MVVSCGDASRATCVSSNPTTLSSSGTRNPRARAASIAPNATSSLPAKIAVGGSGRSSSAAPPASPSSYRNSRSHTYSFGTGAPAASIAPRNPFIRAWLQPEVGGPPR